MQFQVPQFIETEDKIVGPLTLKQFIYMAVTASVVAVLYFMVTTGVWVVLTIPIATLGMALAFIKINGRPFTTIAIAAFNFYWKPQTYVWHPKDPSLPKNESTIKSVVGGGFSLEKILSGLALKGAWEQVQTGNKTATDTTKQVTKQVADKIKARYEILQHISGERRAVKRIDYR